VRSVVCEFSVLRLLGGELALCLATIGVICSRFVTGRDPVLRGPRLAVGIVVHHVDVLERKVRRFVQEEEDNDSSSQVTSGENESVRVVDLLSDERSEECEKEIEAS